MLIENRIVDGKIVAYDKVQASVNYIKAFEPDDGYWVAFSGGKDSVVILELCIMAGVKFHAYYNLTTVDPPELVRFIKEFYPEVTIIMPNLTMWQLIVKKRMPPTRVVRYCCAEFKENGGQGKVVVTGVRKAESVSRAKNRNLVNIGTSKKKRIVFNNDNDESRRTVENCYRTKRTLLNPIIDWLDEDVWEFINLYQKPYCSLYDEGWKRLGCIGCPMADQEKEFERWPKYKQMYIKAFQRMIDKRKEDGLTPVWNTGKECFDWWVGNNKKETAMDGQIDFDEVKI